jgi:L-ribulose-5-phosphate 3-epimerase
MDRRTLFKDSLLVAGGVALAGPAAAAPSRPLPFKISLAEWSLHRGLQDRSIDPLDFARIANGFGIDAIEYVNQFFMARATDRAYLAEMKRRASGEGIWSALIMVDDEGRLGDSEALRRSQTVDRHKKWIDAAAYLGCHSVRVNAHADGTAEEASKRVAEGLRRLCEMADPLGINVLVENHGELTSNGAWLARTLRRVGHPRCGALPDFGNFGDYDRYQGVTELMPLARAVSAKSHAFDRRGNETKTDYARMMKIVTAAGFHGYVGIEFEGDGPELAGIAATKALLERVRATLPPPAVRPATAAAPPAGGSPP